MIFEVKPIGIVQSPFNEKFGIPRQPELAPAAQTIIILNHEFGAESVRGLAGFDYIWVQFIFHDAISEGWAQMIRPPRLGGKKKVGVFSTRSPHRPNHIGLSLLRLFTVNDTSHPIQLICGGSDLLNNTPILDIKPYLPFVEAKPDAQSGFAPHTPTQLNICWQTNPLKLPINTRLMIEQCLAQDPRPAYHHLPTRIYHMRIADTEITFRIEAQQVHILSIK